MKRILTVMTICVVIVFSVGCSKKTQVRALNGDPAFEFTGVRGSFGPNDGKITGLTIGGVVIGDLAPGEMSVYEDATANKRLPVFASSVTIFTSASDPGTTFSLYNNATNNVVLVEDQKNTVFVQGFRSFCCAGTNKFGISAYGPVVKSGL